MNDMSRGPSPHFSVARISRSTGANAVEQIAALIEHGAKPDARAPDGSTPLHTTAHHGQSAAVAALLQADVDPDARNVDGTKPLHLAASAGDAASIELLVAYGADTEAWTPGNGPPSTASPETPRHPSARCARRQESGLRSWPRNSAAKASLPRNPGPTAPKAETTKRRRDMTGRDGEAAVEIRKGDHVRQPDGSWLPVERVDKDGAWVEGNLVTSRVPAGWARENVRTETEAAPDAAPCNLAAPDRGEASGPRPEAQLAGNGRSTAGQAYEIHAQARLDAGAGPAARAQRPAPAAGLHGDRADRARAARELGRPPAAHRRDARRRRQGPRRARGGGRGEGAKDGPQARGIGRLGQGGPRGRRGHAAPDQRPLHRQRRILPPGTDGAKRRGHHQGTGRAHPGRVPAEQPGTHRGQGRSRDRRNEGRGSRPRPRGRAPSRLGFRPPPASAWTRRRSSTRSPGQWTSSANWS